MGLLQTEKANVNHIRKMANIMVWQSTRALSKSTKSGKMRQKRKSTEGAKMRGKCKQCEGAKATKAVKQSAEYRQSEKRWKQQKCGKCGNKGEKRKKCGKRKKRGKRRGRRRRRNSATQYSLLHFLLIVQLHPLVFHHHR